MPHSARTLDEQTGSPASPASPASLLTRVSPALDRRVVSLVKSYAKSLVVDLAFVIEAQSASELPERVIGCGRLAHIQLAEARIPSFEAHSAA